MGKGSFRALVAMGILVPVITVLAVLIHPRSRAAIAAFFAPLPVATRDAGAGSLPPLVTALGPESAELRTLREDATAQDKAAASAPLRPRPAIFLLNAQGEIPASAERYVRPAGLRRPDIMLRDDASVDRAVQHLIADSTARDRFVEVLRRTGRVAPEISRIMRAWKLSDAMVAVPFVETGFQPTTASPDGSAMGAWQLTPDVAHVYGLSILPAYDERRGVTQGTEAAARYLADLHERFASWELALAAYALGYKRTSDEVTKQNTTDFYQLAPGLPHGVGVYVAEVLGTAVVLTNLDRFGLDSVKRADVMTTSDLEVSGGMALSMVARAASISLPALKELNPEYGADTVPSTSFPLMAHVPSGSLARARELLPQLKDGKDVDAFLDGGSYIHEEDAGITRNASGVRVQGTDSRMFYRVKEGDTLASLAKEYSTTVETLASDNALDATSSLNAGNILSIRLPAIDAGTSTGFARPPRPKKTRK